MGQALGKGHVVTDWVLKYQVIISRSNSPLCTVCVQVVRQSDSDKVTVIGACVTLVEALKAADELAKAGVNIRIIDPFTIKPIDAETIINSARKTGGRIITVEDHYSEGEHHNCVCGISSTRFLKGSLPFCSRCLKQV